MDLEAEFKAVSEGVRHAAVTASESLTQAGIRHALVGSLAVGAHARPRATLDVAFIIGNEAFVQNPGGVVTHRSGVPVAPVESLVLLKLSSRRIQDSADVIAIVQSGADVPLLREHVRKFEPALVARLDDLAIRAETEPD